MVTIILTQGSDPQPVTVQDDHGAQLARVVARTLVTYLQRPGNQAQMSMFVAHPPPEHELVRNVVDRVGRQLDSDLSTATLAHEAGVSERHLTRLFVKYHGQTPGRFVRQARTKAAARLIASSRLTLARVAARCGSGSAETLRQAFIGQYGISPSHYRTTQSTRTIG